MNVLDLLKNTDYDVQQHIGDILKPIREQQRKEAHKKLFIDTLEDIEQIGECYDDLTSQGIQITKADSVIDMLKNLDYFTDGSEWEEHNWSHELFVHTGAGSFWKSFSSDPNWNE